MASKPITGELVRVGSHWVTLELARRPGDGPADYRWAIIKEECYPKILTEWRGQSVILEMSADRYESSGQDVYSAPWRVIAQDARARVEGTGEGVQYGAAVSDLARRRLGEALKPMVWEWLRSNEYKLSKREAVQHAMARVLKDGRDGTATRYLRAAVSAMLTAGEISAEDRDEWLKVADLRDAYETALEELDT